MRTKPPVFINYVTQITQKLNLAQLLLKKCCDNIMKVLRNAEWECDIFGWHFVIWRYA